MPLASGSHAPNLVMAIRAAGNPISLDHGVHRGEDLDEIEGFLNAG